MLLICYSILYCEESTWNPWNACGIFHMEFIWTPWIPGGIWPFHVEYAWKKITKMGGVSPKTYSIWNGWNPFGMTWIPHGFHVECGGRVKTSLDVMGSEIVDMAYEE
jgi:hypothetical protein